MRGSSAMKLLAACCGGLPMSMPVDAAKEFYDRRTGVDFGSDTNCKNAVRDNTRYIQVEVFDYNLTPWIKATYTQIADECGGNNFTPYSATMEYNGNKEGDVTGNRLQMDMYICAPFGEYELEIQVKSTNGAKAMERVAWEIEYGPDEYHIWDTLNTPFFRTANGATPADFPYAPKPKKYSGSGPGTIYKWPLPGSEGYYSTLYTGPFPPKHCPNLYPSGVDYEGCYPKQSGWTSPTAGPSGSKNDDDPAEPYRLFDGLGSGDDGVDEVGVMTLEKCAGICSGYSYMGLQKAVQCICGNSISGKEKDKCDLKDDDKIPEYKFLCSGDSRVLCGTDTMVSIYSLGGTGPTPTPPTPTPPTPTPPTPTPPTPTPPTPTPPGGDSYESRGCSKDNIPRGSRVMPLGPITRDKMSAEICFDICRDENKGYTYFGTQYSKECFCAATVPGNLDLDHGGCNMQCKNNAGETCGGNNAISVYEIGDAGPTPTPPTPTPPTPTPPTPTPPTPTPPTPTPPTPTPPTPTPPGGDGYESRGCSKDNIPRGSRVMPLGPITQDKMSAEICFDICRDENKGYTYFGTQYSKECFCAATVPNNLDLGHDGCDMQCKNNAGETCGGRNAISVYAIGDAGPTPTPPTPTPPTPTPPTPTPPTPTPPTPTPPTPTPPTPTPPGGDGYEPLGCFADAQPGPNGKEVRIMGDKTSSNDMTAEVCFAACNDGTNTHFGTQWGRECWCVDDPTLESINQFNDVALPCDFECTGDASEKCGGVDAMTVYEIN